MGNRKLPFGYKMVVGEIVVHPQEAQAVQGIYARYLAGASFNDITDHLKEKGPPYDADKPWNKNMVARILEDNRYAGYFNRKLHAGLRIDADELPPVPVIQPASAI